MQDTSKKENAAMRIWDGFISNHLKTVATIDYHGRII
jgi:hypothetical protein